MATCPCGQSHHNPPRPVLETGITGRRICEDVLHLEVHREVPVAHPGRCGGMEAWGDQPLYGALSWKKIYNF